MKFAIITVGSHGDFFPMIGVAQALSLRGHDVTLMAASSYPDVISMDGVRFIPLSDPETTVRSAREKWLFATRYGSLYVERYSVDWNCVAYDTIRTIASEDLIIIAVDRPNLWADLLARARLGIPVIRVQLDPPVIRDVRIQPEFLPWGHLQHRLAARYQLKWRQLAIDRGIDSGHLRLDRLWRSVRHTVPTVALWPRWILGRFADEYSLRTFGFLPGPTMTTALPQVQFGKQDRPLVVFVAGTEGTTTQWAGRFFGVSDGVCKEVQCAGVFLGGPDGCAPSSGSEFVHARKFLPLDHVLPKASVIVHHGGIGTSAAAIRQGVPQIVIPRVFAQSSNAEWLRRIGLCAVLNRESYTVAQAGAAVREVLTNPQSRAVAEKYSRRCNAESSLQAFCEYLEDRDLVSQLRARGPAELARKRRARTLNVD